MSAFTVAAVAPRAVAAPRRPFVAAKSRRAAAPVRRAVLESAPVSSGKDFEPEADLELSDLTAISPLDGRYGAKIKILRACFSEYALVRARVIVEVRWLQKLASIPLVIEIAPPVELAEPPAAMVTAPPSPPAPPAPPSPPCLLYTSDAADE